MLQNEKEFPLRKQNFIIVAIGFAIIILGFILMSGGASKSPDVFNPAIFSFRRIILAPTLVIIGFIIEVFAILKKTKE